MARENGRDFIYVVWQDPRERDNYVIGTLTRNGHYEFVYGVEVEKARQHGFTPLVSFPDFKATYQSDEVFPAFACRLPDPRRRGIEDILKKYGLIEYDEFEFLKKSGARLPTDTLSFIDPILDSEEEIERIFYVAGTRYYMGCTGKDCTQAKKIEPGAELNLVPEPDNQHDKYAIAIYTQDGTKVGFLPRYYSESVSERLQEGRICNCHVLEYTPSDHCCTQCLRVRLKIEKRTMEQK